MRGLRLAPEREKPRPERLSRADPTRRSYDLEVKIVLRAKGLLPILPAASKDLRSRRRQISGFFCWAFCAAYQEAGTVICCSATAPFFQIENSVGFPTALSIATA